MSQLTSIGIVLAENDKSIIKWLNMLVESGESPRTWLQAVLLADSLNFPIDIGTVYITPDIKKTSNLKTGKYLMFGDDTVSNSGKEKKKKNKINYGWNIRGKDGEYVPGSIFCFNITRTALLPIIKNITDNYSNISSYVKAVLRKYLKTTSDESAAYIPDNTAIKDLFALYASKPKSKHKSAKMIDGKSEPDLVKVSKSDKIKTELKNEVSDEIGNKQNFHQTNKKNPLLQYIT